MVNREGLNIIHIGRDLLLLLNLGGGWLEAGIPLFLLGVKKLPQICGFLLFLHYTSYI
jgi:hypothetical protein